MLEGLLQKLLEWFSPQRRWVNAMMAEVLPPEEVWAQIAVHRVWKHIREGRELREKDLKLIKKAGYFKPVGKATTAKYAAAAYRLTGGYLFEDALFSKKLSLVNYATWEKKWLAQREAAIVRTIEQKQLSPGDAALLERQIYEYEERTLYGGPGLPYPEIRHNLRSFLQGEYVDLYFDQDFMLVVAIKRPRTKDEVIWERAGARKPELYH